MGTRRLVLIGLWLLLPGVVAAETGSKRPATTDPPRRSANPTAPQPLATSPAAPASVTYDSVEPPTDPEVLQAMEEKMRAYFEEQAREPERLAPGEVEPPTDPEVLQAMQEKMQAYFEEQAREPERLAPGEEGPPTDPEVLQAMEEKMRARFEEQAQEQQRPPSSGKARTR